MDGKIMNYYERLRNYEIEKRMLMDQNLTPKEFEKKIRELTRKWRI